MCTTGEIENYHLVIKNLERIESLFNSRHVNVTEILQELKKCCKVLENIISKENTGGSYLPNLIYLKQTILEQIQIMENKSAKAFNKTHSMEDRARNIVKNTIETPLVNSLKEIAGLWDVKRVLKSLVILPQNQPQLFTNRKTCNSVLLFGPPGTGKTRLVHALAAEANAVLHCVSISSMMSPFVGQTEKNLQILFDYVRTSDHFSILFIDEVDGFCRKRQDSEQDHTRRMKTELMCQMSKTEDVKNLFLICVTNCPWDLDTAFLRRFHRHLYVPLPNQIERRELFQLFTKDTPLAEESEHWDILIEQTEGFSGSDISNLVQSALNVPIMELEDTKIWKLTEDGFYEPVDLQANVDLDDIVCDELYDLPRGLVRARQPKLLDIWNCLGSVAATVSPDVIARYEVFNNS